MRVFMTGATGVIGSRTVPLLVRAGHDVTAMARSAQGRDALRRAGATALEASIFDIDELRRAMAGHDVVVNLATSMPASARQMMLPWAWRENDRVRRDGSHAVATAAHAEGVARLIQESFAPIYADHGDRWIDESSPTWPTRYNRTILDAERSAERFTERGGVGVVLRFGALYGPDPLLAEMLDALRRGWSPLPGPATAFFSSLAQDDAATAVVAALDVTAGVYNIVEDEPMRRGDWVRTLAAAAGLAAPRPLPRWLVKLGGSAMELLSRSERISNGRFRAACDWAPRYRSASDAWQDVLRTMRSADGYQLSA